VPEASVMRRGQDQGVLTAGVQGSTFVPASGQIDFHLVNIGGAWLWAVDLF